MRRLLPAMAALALLFLFSCATGPIKDEPLATAFTLGPRECGIPGSFAATEELSIALLVILAFLGSSTAFAFDRHIRVTYFIEKLSPPLRRGLSGACS